MANTRSLFLTLCLLPAVSAIAPAAILAQYQFTGGSAASTDTDPFTNASSFGLTATGSSISAASNNLFLRSSNTASTTETEAVTNNTYVSFTLTPTVGAQYNLDILRLNHGASNSDTDAAFLTNVFIKSSIGGFGSADPTLATFTKSVPTGSTGAGITDPQVIDLTAFGSTFTNLTGPVEFRFYFYDESSSANKIHRLDSVQLEGSAIPEPGSLVLILTGAAGSVFRRSRGSSARKFHPII